MTSVFKFEGAYFIGGRFLPIIPSGEYFVEFGVTCQKLKHIFGKYLFLHLDGFENCFTGDKKI